MVKAMLNYTNLYPPWDSYLIVLLMPCEVCNKLWCCIYLEESWHPSQHLSSICTCYLQIWLLEKWVLWCSLKLCLAHLQQCRVTSFALFSSNIVPQCLEPFLQAGYFTACEFCNLPNLEVFQTMKVFLGVVLFFFLNGQFSRWYAAEVRERVYVHSQLFTFLTQLWLDRLIATWHWVCTWVRSPCPWAWPAVPRLQKIPLLSSSFRDLLVAL